MGPLWAESTSHWWFTLNILWGESTSHHWISLSKEQIMQIFDDFFGVNFNKLLTKQ